MTYIPRENDQDNADGLSLDVPFKPFLRFTIDNALFPKHGVTGAIQKLPSLHCSSNFHTCIGDRPAHLLGNFPSQLILFLSENPQGSCDYLLALG